MFFLARSQVRRPKWAQHFLKDEAVCRKIVNALSLQEDDLVVEIGAGRGAMTRLLADRAQRVVAIEIDVELAKVLHDAFSGRAHVEIVCADILEMDFSSLLKQHKGSACYVFGNLPYYITSPILHRLFSASERIRHMTLLMQQEVGERVAAAPGTRSYGYLSVLAQLDSEPRIQLVVPPGAFSPPPKVWSALVDFPVQPRFPGWNDQDHDAFLAFAQVCFRQKRKSLLNNLAQVYSRESGKRVLEAQGIRESIRAEQLGLLELAEIFRKLETRN
jgi:16S rRNA (adenine1518-N6/adenine1519-N6)-dimethyltransferase